MYSDAFLADTRIDADASVSIQYQMPWCSLEKKKTEKF